MRGRPFSFGYGAFQQPVYEQLGSQAMQESGDEMAVSQSQLLQLSGRLLRVLLSTPQPILHSHLRAKVLGAEENSEAGKCLFELAVLSLVEQQLVVRHGFGGCNTALYSVPSAAARQAAEIAYAEFPDDQRFVYTASRVAARVPCGYTPRRHGSPRQLAGRTRGVEKSSAARARSKRGLGDELAAQRQKRVRAELDSGCAPMSP